jgi:uncharacterized membrane protein YjjB (DUF3815 family)
MACGRIISPLPARGYPKNARSEFAGAPIVIMMPGLYAFEMLIVFNRGQEPAATNEGNFRTTTLAQATRASTMLAAELVAITRVKRKPALLRRNPYSAAVRSWPPIKSIVISSIFPG